MVWVKKKPLWSSDVIIYFFILSISKKNKNKLLMLFFIKLIINWNN